MPRIVKLGLVQMHSDENVKGNVERAMAHIKDAAAHGAKIIALPELFAAPYFCQQRDKKFFELAEAVPGPTSDALCKVARETKTAITTSIFEKSPEGKFYNTAVIIDADGTLLGTYRKIHIPDDPANHYDEAFYFSPGDQGVKVFQTKYAKIAPQICYDQWFPEGARIAGQKGAEILFYPTAIGWPTFQRDMEQLNIAENRMWVTTQVSHGIDNNCFVATVNRVGLQDDLQFWGTSFVSDPYGRTLAEASTEEETNLIVTCDLDIIARKTKDWPFQSDCAKVVDKITCG